MKNTKQCLFLLIFILLFSIAVSIYLGNVKIDREIITKFLINRILQKKVYEENWNNGVEIILLNIRIPRILMAGLAGAALSIVGVLMQTLTKNPLAEPFILGISSGASAGAVSVIIFGLLPFLGASAVPVGSFAGAAAAIMLVMLLTGKRQDSIKLILLGVGISAFFNAVTTLVIYMAKNDSQMKSAIFWMLGSLAVTEWKNLILPAVLLLILLIVSSFISKELDILLLGDNTASQLGLNIVLVKLVLIIFSSLLIGVIVSICGIIGFVGLIIPHITRKLVGNKHKVLIPFSMLLGSIFLIWADNIARICFAPEELPIGIISSFLGAPFLILVVLRNYKFGDSNDGN